jgi:two-component system chemotaxis response regulator CheY
MPKILIVDDASFIRLKMRQILTEAGYEVVEAANGQKAVEQFCSEHPDGILMDITMPEMDGLEALALIRRVDPGARIAMVTAMGQESNIRDALNHGACDFIVKPFRSDRVLATVSKMLRRAPGPTSPSRG